MKITATTTVTLTFSVSYFEHAEGGMNTGSYGNDVSTLEQAVDLWRQASVAQPARDWVIVTEPNVQVDLGKAS